MRKLDIAFAAALILVVVLFGAGLLVVQKSRNLVSYPVSQSQTAIPMPQRVRMQQEVVGT